MSIIGAIGGLGGSLLSGLFSSNNANKQIALQKQFAQNGIQWKVADAKAAGVHPLAALGASTTSYAPVSVQTPDLGPAMQSLGNAVHKTADPADRAAIDLTLEKAALENELLRTQINSARALRTQSPGIPTRTTSRTGQPALADPPPPEHSGLLGGFTHDRTLSDAQKYEDRYGDVIQEIAGMRNFFNDWSRTRTGLPFMDYMHLESARRLRGRDYGRDYRHR